jgi:hypothetical protein
VVNVDICESVAPGGGGHSHNKRARCRIGRNSSFFSPPGNVMSFLNESIHSIIIKNLKQRNNPEILLTVDIDANLVEQLYPDEGILVRNSALNAFELSRLPLEVLLDFLSVFYYGIENQLPNFLPQHHHHHHPPPWKNTSSSLLVTILAAFVKSWTMTLSEINDVSTLVMSGAQKEKRCWYDLVIIGITIAVEGR